MTRHVLLIDDDDAIREVATMSLELVGKWRVTAASGGSEGLAKATADRPDAILLDVMMPEMDGPTTLARLRNTAEISDVPVVLLTAKAQTAERRTYSELNVSGVLTKPFDPMLLPTLISELLGWPLNPAPP